MSFSVPPLSAIRSVASTLPRSAATVAAAGRSLIDAATPPPPDRAQPASQSPRRGNAPAPPTPPRDATPDPTEGTNSGTDPPPDLARAALGFMTAAQQHRASLAAADRLLRTGEPAEREPSSRTGATRPTVDLLA
jgi:hypothetical protein